jgi:hypothetical protein
LNTEYDTDFHAWAFEQAGKLRAGETVDRDNIAEELEDLGRKERHQLTNRMAVLLAHLLKWEFQPEKRSPGWTATMKEQRLRIRKLLAEMPSLKTYLDESIVDAYGIALIFASTETRLVEEDFPAECPWTQEEILG